MSAQPSNALSHNLSASLPVPGQVISLPPGSVVHVHD